MVQVIWVPFMWWYGWRCLFMSESTCIRFHFPQKSEWSCVLDFISHRNLNDLVSPIFVCSGCCVFSFLTCVSNWFCYWNIQSINMDQNVFCAWRCMVILPEFSISFATDWLVIPSHNKVVRGYIGLTLFVRQSLRPSVRPSRIPCQLCNTYSSGWIHFIFIHLIRQLCCV